MLNKSYPEEYPITLYVNKQELLTAQLTEVDLKDWAIGYLYAEGLIDFPEEVLNIYIEPYRGNVVVELSKTTAEVQAFLKKKRILTAGCGRGVTFRTLKEVGLFKKVKATRRFPLTFIQQKMREFGKSTPLYIKTGGMHAAAVIEPDGNLIVREDIGRHNAVDKAIGAALKKGLRGEELALITTGRISFEMCSKVARFGVGLAASKTAATNLAIALAKELSIDLVGYCRGRDALVYTPGHNLLKDAQKHVYGFS